MGNAYGPFSTQFARHLDAAGDVLSSGDEADEARKRKKKPPFRQKAKKPLAPVFAADGKTILVQPRQPGASAVLPKQILPFADIVSAAPHICLDPGKPDAKCKGSSSSSSKESKYREDPLTDPEFHPLFVEMLKSLPQPDIAVQIHGRKLNQKEVIEGLANGSIELSTVSCYTESVLLGEAGSFRLRRCGGALRTFPPCINGEAACFQAKHYNKRVGRSWMTDEELERFTKEDHTPPQRICIICHRMIIGGIFSSMLAEGERITIDEKTTLLQQFCNKKECDGGYKEQFLMFSPAGRKIRGLWGPFVMFQPKYLLETVDEDGFWCLDQQALCWKPVQALLPEIGETNQDFQ